MKNSLTGSLPDPLEKNTACSFFLIFYNVHYNVRFCKKIINETDKILNKLKHLSIVNSMLKLIFISVVIVFSSISLGYGTSGSEYREKRVVLGVEDVCNFKTELNDGSLMVLESDDDSLYLEIEASDGHIEYYEVNIEGGKLVVREREFVPDGRQAVNENHPFFSSSYAKGIHVGGGAFFGAKSLKMNGCRLFGNGDYWEPSFVKIYRPKKCKEIEIAEYMDRLEDIEKAIVESLWSHIRSDFEPRFRVNNESLKATFIDGEIKEYIFQDVKPILKFLEKGESVEKIAYSIEDQVKKRYDDCIDMIKEYNEKEGTRISIKAMGSFFLKIDREKIINIIKMD